MVSSWQTVELPNITPSFNAWYALDSHYITIKMVQIVIHIYIIIYLYIKNGEKMVM